ncbi:hypothetical protein [Aeromicrobium endophyticum]|uniref:Uncharacterized protein n=1 Tax=Aeromicrobium endophyticum TaxID=2292704 RepID=A0A371P9L3_9ACTN|nr:hypothetical protein [Aeromicrobium endophyticum]REK72186.1 hypothetical protein DX116_00620 [Aeromicrobium endophyticum]
MTFLDEPASVAARRHGRWQMVLVIVSLVVIGALLVVDPRAVGASDGRLTRELNPWSATLVTVVTLWAAALLGLVVRHRAAIRADRAARNAFATASVVMAVFPLVPGVLLWFCFGLPASVIGLVCLVVTVSLNPPSRPSLEDDRSTQALARLHTGGLMVITSAGFLCVAAVALTVEGADDAWSRIQALTALVGVPLALWAVLLVVVLVRRRRDVAHDLVDRSAVRGAGWMSVVLSALSAMAFTWWAVPGFVAGVVVVAATYRPFVRRG